MENALGWWREKLLRRHLRENRNILANDDCMSDFALKNHRVVSFVKKWPRTAILITSAVPYAGLFVSAWVTRVSKLPPTSATLWFVCTNSFFSLLYYGGGVLTLTMHLLHSFR